MGKKDPTVPIHLRYTTDGDADASVLVPRNWFDTHVDVFPVLPNAWNHRGVEAGGQGRRTVRRSEKELRLYH